MIIIKTRGNLFSIVMWQKLDYKEDLVILYCAVFNLPVCGKPAVSWHALYCVYVLFCTAYCMLFL